MRGRRHGDTLMRSSGPRIRGGSRNGWFFRPRLHGLPDFDIRNWVNRQTYRCQVSDISANYIEADKIVKRLLLGGGQVGCVIFDDELRK